MPLPTVDAIPAAPSRGQRPEVFSPNAEAFFAALPGFVDDLNALSPAMVTESATANYNATSATSVTIGLGAKAFTIEAGKKLVVGDYVKATRRGAITNWMLGAVTAYDAATGALSVNVEALAGSGTAADWNIALSAPLGLEGAPSPDTERIAQNRANLRAQALLLASLLGDRIDLVGGWADPFTDQSDVDTTASLNEIYSSGSYSRSALGPDISTTAGAIESGHYDANAASRAFDNNAVSSWGSGVNDAGLSWIGQDFGTASKVVGFSIQQHLSAQYTSDTVALDYSDNAATWTQVSQHAIVAGVNAPIATTDVGSHRYWRLRDISGTGGATAIGWAVYEVELFSSGGVDLVLVSNNFTAPAVPIEGRVVIQGGRLGGAALALNSNLVAEISRNGGTTYTPVALAASGIAGGADFSFWEGAVSLTGQSSGSLIRYRITVAAALNFRIDGVVLEVR